MFLYVAFSKTAYNRTITTHNKIQFRKHFNRVPNFIDVHTLCPQQAVDCGFSVSLKPN